MWKEFLKPSRKLGGFSFFLGADSPANRVPIPPACGPWLPEKPFLGGSSRSARPESRRNLAQRIRDPRFFHHGGVLLGILDDPGDPEQAPATLEILMVVLKMAALVTIDVEDLSHVLLDSKLVEGADQAGRG